MTRSSVRNRRMQFEALERRDTPSAGLAGGVDAAARHPRPITFSGSGTAVYVSNTSASITGTGTPIGNFSGTLTATSVSHATVVLSSAGGQLDFSTTGKLPTGKSTHFHGTFKIDSGTGTFSAVTGGHGNISGTLHGDSLSFTINGKITE